MGIIIPTTPTSAMNMEMMAVTNMYIKVNRAVLLATLSGSGI